MWRVDLGFLFCAFALPLLMLVTNGMDVSAVIVAGITAVFTGGATLLGCLPLYRWCRERRFFMWWPFLMAGAAAGLVVSAMMGAIFFSWQLSLFFVCIGAFHGTLFWLIAICRNQALRELSSD